MWVVLIITAVIALASLIVTLVMMPSVDDRSTATQEFGYPTVEEGREIPVVFGTVEITSPNIVWYGDESHYTLTNSDTEQPTDYYHLGVHYVLCHGPTDHLKHVFVDKNLVWRDPTFYSTAASGQTIITNFAEHQQIFINMEVYQGEPTQFGIVYPGPAFCPDMGDLRGVLSVIVGHMFPVVHPGVGAHSEIDDSGTYITVPNPDYTTLETGYVSTKPQLGAWSFTVTRISKRQNGIDQWYPEKMLALTDGGNTDYVHMNPAHILRECLTDPDWGMGYADSDIDDVSFMAAADTLVDEQFGMSFLWSRQTTLESFVGMILKHVNGTLYVSRTTGKFTFKLIREDYTVGSLPVFGPSNVLKAPEVAWSSIGDLVNSVTVQYTFRGKDASVTVQDTALVLMQGGVIDHTVQYQGIQSRDLAAKAAARDLKALSTPRINCSLTVNQDARNLNIGDAFVLNWPDYSINNRVMRVTGLNLGNGTSNTIRITAVEDVFAAPQQASVVDPPGGWEPPGTPPVPLDYHLATEIPYQMLALRRGQTNVDVALDFRPNLGFLVAAAARKGSASSAKYAVDSGDTLGYKIGLGAFSFCPTATLVDPINKRAIQFSIENDIDLNLVRPNTVVQVDDELMRVVSYNSVDGKLLVGRGVLDTVPADHAADARLMFWGSAYYFDPTERQDTDPDPSVKILPQTSVGTLSPADADADVVDLRKRAIRPYPPGQLGWNGVPFPATLTEPLNLSWAHRDRKQQVNGQIVDTNAPSIGPEAGTTYVVRLRNNVGSLVSEWTGIAGTSKFMDLYDLPGSTATVELGSMRDGIASWQDHSHTFNFTRGVHYIVMPLLYDEKDYNDWLTWERQGYAPNVMPGGFYGDGIRGRLKCDAVPGWLSPATRELTLHAKVELFNSYPPVAGGDIVIHLGEDVAGTSPKPKMALKAIPDPALATRPYLALQMYTSALQTMPLARPDWSYLKRYPTLTKRGNHIQPRGITKLSTGDYIHCGHFNSTETEAYVMDTSGVQTGMFTFGTSTHKTIGGFGVTAAGDLWCVDYQTKHTLKLNLASSLSTGTAVVLTDWDTSAIDARSMAFYTAGTEYVLLAEYKTTGTAYLYSIPVASMTGTFTTAARYRRWDIGLFVTGICIDSYGTLLVTRATGAGTVETLGIISSIHGSIADGDTVNSTGTFPAPSARPMGIAEHPSFGFWVVTDGWSTAADRDGWSGIWHGAVQGEDADRNLDNTVIAHYNGSGSVDVSLNGQAFETQSWTPTIDVDAVSIGGPPQTTEGFSSGFFKGLLRRVRLQDGAMTSDEIDETGDNTYVPNQLRWYSRIMSGSLDGDGTTGWTNEVGTLSTKSSSPVPYNGTGYLYGGSNLQTIARQRYELTSFFDIVGLVDTLTTAEVDTGLMWAQIGWAQASLGASDPCSIGLRFLDASLTQLSETYGLADSVPGGDGGTTANWHRLSLNVPVPVGARWVDILYKSDRTSGTPNDGYIDNISTVSLFRK